VDRSSEMRGGLHPRACAPVFVLHMPKPGESVPKVLGKKKNFKSAKQGLPPAAQGGRSNQNQRVYLSLERTGKHPPSGV